MPPSASRTSYKLKEIPMPALADSPRISPFLWFDANAEQAVDFYLSIFPNSRILETFRSPVETPGAPAGSVLTITFELDGQHFTAMNGGPGYPFTNAISFFVRCDTQQVIDDYWSKLTAGGTEIQCGWLKDKFGLVWQIVPTNITALIRHPKAMQAMMQMVKFDIATLERAAQE
jgi:predicted 3-demethylubiquinone-9 3-methyltransferase (glyoxalase superfamily)